MQFGGQTPLRLAAGLEEAGVPLLGTQPEAIDLAEDRGRFGALLGRLGLKAPAYATAHSEEEALAVAPRVGFPLLVRPSYVLGGRAMEIVYSLAGLEDYLLRVARGSHGREIFLDRFLENAVEVDVDAICDGEDVWIGGVMQHVEEAGIHSGDSACVLPPHSLGREMRDEIAESTRRLALALGCVGLMNVQYAVLGDDLYVIEANPRASRTVPFVSKATGIPLAKMACRVMLGEKLATLDLPADPLGDHVAVKEAVMPFDRFAGSDSLLGPEMRSTGEVMGVAHDFPAAFAKAQAAAGARLPRSGTVFLTVTDSDKAGAVGIAAQLHDLGFAIVATRGTAAAISRMGIPVQPLNKIAEGSPHVVDWIERGDVDLVINTPTGTAARTDGYEIRGAATARGIPCITTLSGGMAAARAIAAARHGEPGGRVAAGAARAGLGGAVRERRTLAPLGRRLCPVVAHARYGAYDVISVLDAEGPAPDPGQFYMLAASERWGGGADERPFLPRAFSVLRRHDDGRLDFLFEDVGPGTRRLCELRAGDGLWLLGPLGVGFRAPEDERRPLLVGGGVGIAPLAIWQDVLGGAGAARLPRRRACRGRARCCDDAAGRHRRRLGRLPRARHRTAQGGDRLAAAWSTRAGRRRCSRRCARCARRRTCRPSSRSSPGWRAGTARASGASCRRARATCGCASTVRCSTPATWSWWRDVDLCGIPLAHPIINASGTFDAIAARRAFGDALLARFPFAAFVSKTVTVEPRQGNPPPRLWELPAGMINSIGLPNKGLEGYLAHDLPELAAAAGAADRQRHGLHPRAGGDARVGVRRPRRGLGARAQRLLPERGDGDDHGRRPGARRRRWSTPSARSRASR